MVLKNRRRGSSADAGKRLRAKISYPKGQMLDQMLVRGLVDAKVRCFLCGRYD